jgi:competence protein ComEC
LARPRRMGLVLALLVACAAPDDTGGPEEPLPSGVTGPAVPDAGPEAVPDASEPYAGTGLPDAGAPDAGEVDAGLPDAGEPDAGEADAGLPDAGPAEPDAGMDAGTPDAGSGPAAGRTVERVERAAQVRAGPPAPGTYRVHLIDVGTGLAVLVQGHDFNLLFDGGSSDDKAGISNGASSNRLLAYLWAAVGPSGASECNPRGDTWPARTDSAELTLDYVFLSHAHEDHVSLLDDVLRCYRVRNVVEPGALYDTIVYGDFVQAVANELGTNYYTVVPAPASRQVTVGTRTITFPPEVTWTSFVAGEGAALGDGARFQILHANGTSYSDANRTSLVLRVDLGATSLLLLGDAESGARASPSTAPGDVEAYLLQHYPTELDVDLVQVGHHGSLTSSRLDFVRAVSPALAFISAGPRQYSGVTLPDAEIVQTWTDEGAQVLRTDLEDSLCSEPDRVGVDDTKPGGCDNYVVTLAP